MILFDEKTTMGYEYFNKSWILKKAAESMDEPTIHITDTISTMSEGGAHDYYSNGDYWWPNPNTWDGLPYIRKDGESNPNCFSEHRKIFEKLKNNVANLAAAYKITGNDIYVKRAEQFLKEFFIDETTKMNPNLLYSQAIPGICSGRGIGIIDTLHLIDIPLAIQVLKTSPLFTNQIYIGLKQWFADYLKWMTTSEYGITEMNEKNNHSVCWFVQASVFAWFTDNDEIMDICRERYKKVLLPSQMALDGSFPMELKRTKPYSYSILTLDNMVTLCHLLSTSEDNLWEFELEDGRGIKKGLNFLYPFLKDKSRWLYPMDVEHFDGFPVRNSLLIFAGIALREKKYIDLWKSLDPEPSDPEVRRNIALRQPILWL